MIEFPANSSTLRRKGEVTVVKQKILVNPFVSGLVLLLTYEFTAYMTGFRPSEPYLMGFLRSDVSSSTPYDEASQVVSVAFSNSTTHWIRSHRAVYMYSAFLDESYGVVRVLGLVNASDLAKRRRNSIPFECQLCYEPTFPVDAVSGEFVLLGDLSNSIFEPYFINCAYPNSSSPPNLVSMSYYNSDPIVWLPAQPVSRRVTKGDGTIGLCVPPYKGVLRDVTRIAEYVAYYSAIGVNDFAFYIHSAVPEVLRFLRALQRSDLPFSLNLRPWLGSAVLRAAGLGQGAFINDCAYRYIQSPVQYMLSASLNEFIVPRSVRSLQALVKNARKNASSFTFLSYTFRDPERRLRTMTRSVRKEAVNPPGLTSRVLLEAQKVVEAGLHFPMHVEGDDGHVFDPDDACVNAYVKGRAPSDGTVDDNAIMRFAKEVEVSPVWDLCRELCDKKAIFAVD